MSSILLVHSENSISETLSDILRFEGYTTVVGKLEDLHFSLDLLREQDLVVLDHTPEFSALKILERMRAAYITVPVVVVSAHLPVRDVVGLIKEGARNCLMTPVDLSYFLQVVEEEL